MTIRLPLQYRNNMIIIKINQAVLGGVPKGIASELYKDNFVEHMAAGCSFYMVFAIRNQRQQICGIGLGHTYEIFSFIRFTHWAETD